MDTERYQALVAACRILEKARMAINIEDGPGFTSPAWSALNHAAHYIGDQAVDVFRAEEVSE